RRHTTASISLPTLTTIAQTSLDEQRRQISLEERAFAHNVLQNLEREILQLSHIPTEGIASGGDKEAEDMKTPAEKQAEREATLREFREIEERKKENIKANMNLGQQSEQAAAQAT